MNRVGPLVLGALVAGGGCTPFLDLTPPPPRDGGPPGDADVDADADTGPLAENCAVDGDEDGNGLADCADFACVGEPRCCDAEDPLGIVEDWEDLADWDLIPRADPEAPEREPGRLLGFGPGTIPRAVLRRECVPLVAGLAARVTFAPQRDGACVGDDPCDAALVLTGARDVRPGERLIDELSVRVAADGRVTARQGGLVVAEGPPIPVGAEVAVTVEAGPGFDDDAQRSVVLATVRVAIGGGAPVPLVERFPVIDTQDLVREGTDCSAAPGLYVAVEGRGSRVEVEPLSLAIQACLNPSVWELPTVAEETLTIDGLSPGVWARGGGIQAPALATSLEPAGEEGGGEPELRFDLAFEGTDVPPALGADTRVGWALGHGVARGDAGWADDWAFVADGVFPKAGDCHPSCLGEPGPACLPASACPEAPSYREPALLPILRPESGTLLVLGLAWAVEVDRAEERFGLGATLSLALDPRFPVSLEPPVVTPAILAADAPPDRSPCDSLRDPSLAPAEPGELGRRWLFFTCEREGERDEIRAVTLTPSLAYQPGSEVRVLSPETPEVAPFGAGGVRSPEALVDFDGQGRAILRLWVLARAVPGAPAALALVRGTADDPARPPTPLVPFPGNPVLTGDDEILGDCDGFCELTGVAVSRRPDIAGRLRFLLARRVDTGSQTRYELRPLEQAGRTEP
jgi:hypothetical protein